MRYLVGGKLTRWKGVFDRGWRVDDFYLTLRELPHDFKAWDQTESAG